MTSQHAALSETWESAFQNISSSMVHSELKIPGIQQACLNTKPSLKDMGTDVLLWISKALYKTLVKSLRSFLVTFEV